MLTADWVCTGSLGLIPLNNNPGCHMREATGRRRSRIALRLSDSPQKSFINSHYLSALSYKTSTTMDLTKVITSPRWKSRAISATNTSNDSLLPSHPFSDFLTPKSCSVQCVNPFSDAPEIRDTIDRKKLVQWSSPTVKCVELRDKRPSDFVKARLDKLCRSDHGPSFVSKASDCTVATASTSGNMDSTCLERTVKPYKNPLKVRFGDAICQSDCRHSNHVICSGDKHSEESLPLASMRKTNLSRQLISMEARIQKVARLELHYLNKAKDFRAKRDALTIMLKSRKTCDDMHHTNVVKKAILIERDYIKKSKKIHNKRYRWTQIYEYTARKWIKQSNGSTASLAFGMKRLPPLLPPSAVGFRRC
jgi:hypothetical protein